MKAKWSRYDSQCPVPGTEMRQYCFPDYLLRNLQMALELVRVKVVIVKDEYESKGFTRALCMCSAEDLQWPSLMS